MLSKKSQVKNNSQNRNEKGITLVALVTTVVVMLILAGVAIAAVVNGDGLFSRARESAGVYENAARDEGDTIKSMINQIDEYLVWKNPPAGEGIIENPINQIVNVNQTYSGVTTGSFSDPIIPKGFKPIGNEQDSTITEGAEWGSENGYQYGLVIQDESGNQFVWVPVDGTNVNFERVDFNNENGYDASDCLETVPSEITESIATNGGFYIARYEAGIAINMPQEELSNDSSATYGNGTYKPVSKKGAIVWNRIQWGENNDDANPGNGAVKVASSMYPVENVNYGVASTLIYGTQWDTALKFIGAYDVGEAGYDTYATNSTGMGNYSGSRQTCGYSDSYRQKNIYDMAGNVYDWTMEASGTSRVMRGAHYTNSGSEYPASVRAFGNADYGNSNLRFPCSALYKVDLSFKERLSN